VPSYRVAASFEPLVSGHRSACATVGITVGAAVGTTVGMTVGFAVWTTTGAGDGFAVAFGLAASCLRLQSDLKQDACTVFKMSCRKKVPGLLFSMKHLLMIIHTGQLSHLCSLIVLSHRVIVSSEGDTHASL
jgi:hypothetical protein